MVRQTTAWGALGIAALTAFSAPVRADEKGERILREALKKINDAQSMTATLTRAFEGENISGKVLSKGTISAMKPNLLLVRITTQVGGAEKTEDVYAATGKKYLSYHSKAKQYRADKLDAAPTEFSGEWEAEIDAFFGGEKLLAKGTANYSGMDKVGDFPCNIVKMTVRAKDQEPERIITYFVGQKDHLIHKTSFLVRIAQKLDEDGDVVEGGEYTQSNILTDINLKAAKKAEDFQYTPPADAKPEAPKRDFI